MPDINLLNDTKNLPDRPKKPKPVPPAPIAFSRPTDGLKDNSNLLKKPSGPSLWLRSLFRRPTPRPKPAPTASASARMTTREPVRSAPTPAAAVDIFSDLDSTRGGPSKLPPTSRGATPAAGPRDLPPLPRIPSWQGRMANVPPAAPAPMKASPVQPSPAPAPAPRMPSITFPAAPAPAPKPAPAPPGPAPKPKNKERKPFLPFGFKNRKTAAVEPEETDQGGVNLLPDELVSTFNLRKQLITLGLVALATALVVGIANFGLLLWKNTQLKKTEEKRALVLQATSEIAKLEPEQRKAISLKSSNDLIRQLMNRHVYWTKFLAAFERVTLPSVAYPQGISSSVGSSLSLNGTAPDLETVIRQVELYRQSTDVITGANVTTLSRDPETGKYSFIMDLSFSPSIYVDPIDPPEKSKTNANANTNASVRTNTNQGATAP